MVSALHILISYLISEIACASLSACKCEPNDSCWPSVASWDALNQSLSGNLIATALPAAVCYPGPQYNANSCASVDAEWSNSTFHAEDPTSIDYPQWAGSPCLPVNASAGQAAVGSCEVGGYPRYTVNGSNITHISEGVDFARTNNIRLVVKDTGHDLLGRSTGYGSLNIWVHNLKLGLDFQQSYKSSDGCIKTTWTSSAFQIRGGYVWGEVYAEAAKRNLIVVGGGDPSVSCLGGWMQGGGHGPATHNYGLGADQVLEAQVVLANGTLVTANACQNPDLFFAIRGGGGGTYGIVVSTTIKAYPTTGVISQTLSIIPLSTINAISNALFDAISVLYSEFPRLSEAGYSGYGSWTTHGFEPITRNSTAGYVHSIAIFNSSINDAKDVFNHTLAKLHPYTSSNLSLLVTYTSYPNYATYYAAESGVQQPVGSNAALTSRFLDRKALTSNLTQLKQTLRIIAGTADQATSINIEFVGGGPVASDQIDALSGVNPAWRDAYVHNIVARGWADGTAASDIQAIRNDMTYVKGAAMTQLAPDTGCYMNEADAFDPSYTTNFYGTHFSHLSAIKETYDPEHVFYCRTCVGSELWTQIESGGLCLV